MNYIIKRKNNTQNPETKYNKDIDKVVDELFKYNDYLISNFKNMMKKEREEIAELVHYFDAGLKPATQSAQIIKNIACSEDYDINFNAIIFDIVDGDFKGIKERMDEDIFNFCYKKVELDDEMQNG